MTATARQLKALINCSTAAALLAVAEDGVSLILCQQAEVLGLRCQTPAHCAAKGLADGFQGTAAEVQLP
jgi:hypothetical protein